MRFPKALKPLYQKNRKEYTVPKVREYELGLTSQQKKILKAIKITEQDYMEFAKDIQSKLS